MDPGKAPKLAHLQPSEVADPDCSNLTLLQERSHRLGAFLYRGERIGPMDLVDIDVVGAQPFQRCFDFGKNPRTARVAKGLSIAPVEAGFGRNHHPVAEAI